MDRRALLAIGLSLAVVILWQFLFPQPEAPQPEPSSPLESEQGTPPVEPVPALPESGGPILEEVISAGAPDTERVEIDQAVVVFTNKGGRVLSWKLKQHKDARGHNLELVPGGDLRERKERWNSADLGGADEALSWWLPLAVDLPREPELTRAANSALYRMERRGPSSAPEVVMTWADGAGHEVIKTVRLGPGYEASVTLEVRRNGLPLPVGLSWGVDFGETFPEEVSANRFAYRGQVLVDNLPKPRRIGPSSLDPDERQLLGGERLWGGGEDTYFTALFLPEPSGRFSVRRADLPPYRGVEAQPALAISLLMEGDGGGTGLYVGPKDYQLLRSMGNRLEEAVYFQSRVPFVTFLTRGLFHSLVFLHNKVVANWGWAIVILTVIIKLIFWPITNRSMLSMKRMQEKTKRVQPKAQAIREKYRRHGKKDIESRQKMNKEVMALYQKEGINPVSNLTGCLPLFLQIPILFAFYNVLQVAIELRQAPFILWIGDLAAMDPYYVLPVVMGGSMVVQQVLTGAAIPDPMQRRMMYMMPVMFTVFFLQMPSGLVVYWLVNNLLGILQQRLINQRHARESAPVPARRRAQAGRKA